MRSPGWRVITQTIYSVLALRWPFLFTTNKSTHLSLCLSRPIRLSVRSSVDQFHIYPSVYLCLPACSSVCPLAYLSVYLPTYPAYHLFQIPVRHAGVRPGDLALDDHQSARLYEVPGFNDERGRRQWRVFVAGRSGQATEVRRHIQPGCVPSVYPASRSLLHRLQCFFLSPLCTYRCLVLLYTLGMHALKRPSSQKVSFQFVSIQASTTTSPEPKIWLLFFVVVVSCIWRTPVDFRSQIEFSNEEFCSVY